LLSFTLSFDVVISEFFVGPGVNTLPRVICSYARRGNQSVHLCRSHIDYGVTIVIVGYSLCWVTQANPP
jgi:putrescine transport system permease protein